MEVSELRRRLRAKDAADASPDLDFDTKLGEKSFQQQMDEIGKPTTARPLDVLENGEGLRKIMYSPLEDDNDASSAERKVRMDKELHRTLENKWSLTQGEKDNYDDLLRRRMKDDG